MKIYHNPPHIYSDNTTYMVTSSTYNENNIFTTDNNKQILLMSLKALLQRFQFQLYGWVILDNHYHMLIGINKGEYLSKFINLLHGGSAYKVNKRDKTEGRKVWYNYWDTCIRNEKDFYTRLNYIHNNPIKHKHVNNLEELHIYKFSSYPDYLKEKGRVWIEDCFIKYPIIDFSSYEPKGSTPEFRRNRGFSLKFNEPKGSTPIKTEGSTPIC